MGQFTGLIGVVVLTLIALALSVDRRRIRPREVLVGIGLQFALAWLMLRFGPVAGAFDAIAALFNRVISFATPGAQFVFGSLAESREPWGFLFAFQVLPIIIFFAALMAVLYHFGIMQLVIAALAWVLRRSIGVTGAEAMAMSANVFVGQTEAPLCVRPFIPNMTRSQLMCLMTGGFSTIAGSVLAAYVGILGGDDPAARIQFAKHLMIASVMSAPAALAISKVMMPETETPPDETLGGMHIERTTRNVFDAAAAGASDGLRLAVNVGAMLLAFVALLAMVNYPLEAISQLDIVRAWREARGIPPLSLQNLLGWLLMPVAWTMGVAWGDCATFGALLGEKLIATEFIAYLSLADHMRDGKEIGERSAVIATYALCGFANLPSIAIQIGGLTALAPNRRSDFASLGLRAMIGGALASWMTATIAGVFLPA